MNRLVFHIFCRLLQTFCERRMRMDHVGDLGDRRSQLYGKRTLMDQIRVMRADDVNASKIAM